MSCLVGAHIVVVFATTSRYKPGTILPIVVTRCGGLPSWEILEDFNSIIDPPIVTIIKFALLHVLLGYRILSFTIPESRTSTSHQFRKRTRHKRPSKAEHDAPSKKTEWTERPSMRSPTAWSSCQLEIHHRWLFAWQASPPPFPAGWRRSCPYVPSTQPGGRGVRRALDKEDESVD